MELVSRVLWCPAPLCHETEDILRQLPEIERVWGSGGGESREEMVEWSVSVVAECEEEGGEVLMIFFSGRDGH